MTTPFSPQLLVDRSLIRLTGENVLGFLHTLLTCAVEGLPPRTWVYGALLSPQGKIQHDIFVIHDGEVVWLDCARSQRSDLIKKLMMYRLRAKVSIDAEDDLAIVAGQDDGLWNLDPRDSSFGARAILPPRGFVPAPDYHASRIAHGLADSDADIGSNTLFPHEANLDLLGGVSFSKGCYVGQEVVSRMQHRGTTRSRILCIRGDKDLPENGAEIRSGEMLIGSTLSHSGEHGLALIRLDRLADAREALLTQSVGVHVHKPRWMNIELAIPDVAT
jgi:tRNA-modifying protein YgfZ